MWHRLNSFYNDFFLSGHSFDSNELLLKFQYKVLNTVLVVMGVFTLIFAVLSSTGLNPLGWMQTTSNYILVVCSIIFIIRLRGPKKRYLQTAYLMYTVAFFDFIVALLFVPHDEFRIIWFYLLVFAAYITGGVRAGNIVSFLSIVTVVLASAFYELYLSQTAIVSAILGLIIASFFIRAYTKKIIDFEKEITEHESLMITQSRFAAMGEMMSMIAHQWRQPLSTTTLLIANERLKMMMDRRDTSEYDKILENISDTMTYLSDTIDDFQTYFKPEKNTKEIFTSELIERVENFVEARLLLARVKLDIQQCKNEPIETYANEMVQVLINIINNSIDVVVEREVPERHIWITISCDEKNVYIKVEDNGGGIDEDVIEKVFEPYFSKKSKNGTGLGLYMSKMIVEKHIGGKIEVKNTLNGACFTVMLPRKSKPISLN